MPIKSPILYHIRVSGHLRPDWSEWFEGMTLAGQENGDTLLSGLVVDQAALHGLLGRVRDLNLLLVSVERIEPNVNAPEPSDHHQG